MWVACLAATGMPISDMRDYVGNSLLGDSAAEQQIELLTKRQDELEREAAFIALRKRYVQLKIDYWHAVAAGDEDRVEMLSRDARRGWRTS